MPTTVRILADIEKDGVPLIDRKSITDGEIEIIGRLPRGTGDGRSTLSIYVRARQPLYDIHGNKIEWFFCETTMRVFLMAATAFQAIENPTPATPSQSAD